MHKLSTTFVLGYHGCDKAVGEALLNGEPFKKSANEWDWLGHGIYFWEANPARALEFAKEQQTRKLARGERFDEPFVVGAVVDLGYCLDFMSSMAEDALLAAYQSYREISETARIPLPENVGGSDKLQRNLDCAVVNHLIDIQRSRGRPLDTVRAVFVEGKEIYQEAGFRRKTHIQISVINPDCIKGVFRLPT
ncbi:hypothetical protein OSH11_22725 [Kaistia dalseonensis]|uniref:DUF3990 domain-containing protein n=1 Tax=Kaistia dalseonensis TaxID=410840 RepID=A0ABU0HCW9_9HYPH|nr:hypothetical protein [Kaistia dalseonensis]MCX5497530.1 hypothetical protein [Kaistia dalseonensis]MDQ0440169.1 hypothetical protein [Kaistia dalseonensis]